MSDQTRTPGHPIEAQFTDRWSPRAFADKSISSSDLMRLFEAARWAPSGSNLQPWRFVYALRGTPAFESLLATLVEFNQGWAKNASALVFVASVKAFDPDRPLGTASFDAGAAWMSLALQAHAQGLVAHGMAGLDYEAASRALGLTDQLKLECAVAIGYAGSPDSLPDFLREREAPSGRQALETMVFEGQFSGSLSAPS